MSALLGLQAGCSSLPSRARHDLIGHTRADLVSCAGVPDQDEIRDGQEVLVWRQDQPVQGPLDLKTPFSFELSLGGHGTCHVTATVQDGVVTRIAYSGPSATLEGPNAACGPVVRGCV
ncbi:hypothetical protein KUA11_02420 [Acetobacter estunensis]|nr:hypothetical protein [Acetobacter estunensis]MBV1836062.1 hypothetical protein [Acetobacter estunensis]